MAWNWLVVSQARRGADNLHSVPVDAKPWADLMPLATGQVSKTSMECFVRKAECGPRFRGLADVGHLMPHHACLQMNAVEQLFKDALRDGRLLLNARGRSTPSPSWCTDSTTQRFSNMMRGCRNFICQIKHVKTFECYCGLKLLFFSNRNASVYVQGSFASLVRAMPVAT